MITTRLSQTKRALLIGNINYDVAKLQRCKNDATDVCDKLKGVGFQVTTGFDLTYQKMMDLIMKFVEEIVENDLVVFFFSGHGTEWKDENYLIPIDNQCLIDQSSRHEYHAVSAQKTLESIKEYKPFAIVFLLDCCRVRNEGAKAIPVQSNSTNVTMIKGVAGSLTVFACGPNEEAFERSRNNRNSLFTYHLLEHIAKPNLKIDEMMCQVCDGVYDDSNGQLYTYRLSTLRTSKLYFNFTEKGMSSLRNSKYRSNLNKIMSARRSFPALILK